jgi:glycosyltransferase involved in cell wall biosynthesis
MRILFLHRNFPAQFVHLAKHFAQDAQNRVVFITERKDRAIPGVLKAVYKIPDRNSSSGLFKNVQMQGDAPVPRQLSGKTESRGVCDNTLSGEVCSATQQMGVFQQPANTHPYLRFYEEAILHGQAAARAALDLKKKGFIPDIIIGHTWGQNLFMKDVFPDTPLVGHFEWFYRARVSDVDFDPDKPLTTDTEARVRIKNSHILVDLYSCDHGICPTLWQYEQFPPEFRHKIKVIHEGIDTDYFKPDPDAKPVWPELKLDLSQAKEIVTYVSRGLEPYRGFPQFMEAAELVLKERSGCHIVIVGEDKVFYGGNLPNGKTYKQAALEKFTGDPSRLHFTGYIPHDAYRRVLQVSSAHVYLTYPFVLSWSMLEAMSSGCLVIASNTPPVREVIRDGENGILFDFFSPQEIAEKVCYALEHQDGVKEIRKQARETVLGKYDLKRILPEQIGWIEGIASTTAETLVWNLALCREAGSNS